jgi:hypothetical protein
VEDNPALPKILSIVYHIVMIILGIVTLVVAIIAYTSLSAYNNAVLDFKENWETLPIVDIQTSLHECPTGYEDLITRKWPGTVSGCQCPFFSRYPALNKGTCNTNQTQDGCYRIHHVNPIPLDKFYSNKICGLREGSNFLNSKRPTKGLGGDKANCPTGYKICGTGAVDKLLCVREQERCPINHIEITSNTNPPKKGYKTLPLDPQQGVSSVNPLFLLKTS